MYTRDSDINDYIYYSPVEAGPVAGDMGAVVGTVRKGDVSACKLGSSFLRYHDQTLHCTSALSAMGAVMKQ